MTALMTIVTDLRLLPSPSSTRNHTAIIESQKGGTHLPLPIRKWLAFWYLGPVIVEHHEPSPQ